MSGIIAPGLGMEGAGQDHNEPVQQIVQARGVHLGAQQAVEGLRLRFADLIVGVVDGEQGAELQLPPDAFERVSAQAAFEFPVVSSQTVRDFPWRNVQLGQPPAVVGNLLEEIGGQLACGQQTGRCA